MAVLVVYPKCENHKSRLQGNYSFLAKESLVEKETSFAEPCTKCEALFFYNLVCSDKKIICLGFNADNTTVLWVTVKELNPTRRA